jgi:hypothetical protein
MSKQTSLSSFGFKNKKPVQHKVSIHIEGVKNELPLNSKPSKFVKGEMIRNGKHMNINGKIEHGIKIDGTTKEYSQKLQRIMTWSASRPKFDISAYYGIMSNAEFTKQFSSRQREAIDNVYYKCDIYADF